MEETPQLNFEDIYRRYGEKILNLAYRYTGNEDTARDLTQDVFTKIFQKLDSFKSQSHIFTWIYRIAVNHFINYMKQERKWRWTQLLDKSVGELLSQESVAEENWSSGYIPAPDRIVEKSEREKIVLNVVNSLPIKYRAPLILQRYEGMNYKEIAETLSISGSAVETRLHRAKKMLVEKLKPWMKHL
ncbi:MAG: sigma-70 family RNA polymerase sigma factor [Calditrichia bacterium]|nr:sigma-70 family RNA polymerase sigma factor [Calditrichia bacterium]